MNRYPIKELIARWSGGSLTVEQMIGQIVLALQEVEQRQQALDQRQRTAERRLDEALAPPESAPPPAPPTKGRRSRQG